MRPIKELWGVNLLCCQRWGHNFVLVFDPTQDDMSTLQHTSPSSVDTKCVWSLTATGQTVHNAWIKKCRYATGNKLGILDFQGKCMEHVKCKGMQAEHWETLMMWGLRKKYSFAFSSKTTKTMLYVFTEFSIGDVPSHVCKKINIVIYWDAHNPF